MGFARFPIYPQSMRHQIRMIAVCSEELMLIHGSNRLGASKSAQFAQSKDQGAMPRSTSLGGILCKIRM